MGKMNVLRTVVLLLTAFLVANAALAATIDPTTRTVTTGNLFVDWSDSNPEEIVDIRWKGSANLTNAASNPFCPGDLEYFGNSWVSEDEGGPNFVFLTLVGWGTTGTWSNPSHNKIDVGSSSLGCFGSVGIPVQTTYRFYDQGAVKDRIMVQRRFTFGQTPFLHDLRPYMPRLYPRDAFSQVLHPDASGTVLLTEESADCEFSCVVTDWDGSWFAIHDPVSGRGLIIRREPSSYSVALWVDQDQASFTNSSSVLLLQPDGGFTGKVVEVEFLRFYDATIWTPSLTLPPGS